MADKFETNKYFRRFMWGLLALGWGGISVLILKYLPPLLLAIKELTK